MFIRPTFYAFETARRAISASQMGLDTVGHNMANIETPGYTRQRVDQVSVSVSGLSKWASRNTHYPGLGSGVIGINQLRDPFLDARYRTEVVGYGEAAVKNAGLTELNAIFDEIQKAGGLHFEFTEFLNSFAAFNENPTSEEYAMIVRNSADQVCKVLNTYSKELESLREKQTSELSLSISDEVNPILEKIAMLNEQIFKSNVYGDPANTLLDQRNLLIDELAGYMNIKVVETPVRITDEIVIPRLSIELRDVSPPNSMLVDHEKFGSFDVDTTTPYDVELHLTAVGSAASVNVTGDLKTGGLRAFIDMINGDGSFNPVSEAFRGLSYAKQTIDNFAKVFADTLNAINQTYNSATPPVIGGDLFVDNTTGNTVAINAGNIGISQLWKDDPKAIITSQNPDTTQNAENLHNFVNALKIATYASINPDIPNVTFAQFLVAFEGQLGLDLSRNTSILDAADVIVNNILDQREAVSGVNMNEEAINMLTYQKYYDAASRYMTTLDQALDTIINSMGIVGR